MDKREQDVLKQVKQKTADIQVPEKLKPDNIRRMLEDKEPEKRSKWGARQTGALIAACMAVVIGVAAWKASGADSMIRTDSSNRASGPKVREDHIDGSRMIAQAESYDQVYGYLEEYQRQQRERSDSVVKQESYDMIAESADGGMKEEFAMTENAEQDRALEDNASAGAAQSMDASEGGGYSETNVRQEGVDEGDIVKTDGAYLYVLEDEEDKIAVIDAKGQDSSRRTAVSLS